MIEVIAKSRARSSIPHRSTAPAWERVLWRVAFMMFLGTAIITATFSLQQSSFAVVMVFLLFSVFGLTLLIGSQLQRAIFLFVYSLSVIIALLFFASNLRMYELPYYQGGSDDLNYEAEGVEFSEQLQIWDYSKIRGNVVQQNHNSVAYVYVVGVMVVAGEALGGFHTILPKLLNCFCLAIIAIIVYRLMLLIGSSRKIATGCAISAALMPGMVFPASHTFRDVLISFLLVSVVFFLVAVNRKHMGRVVAYLMIGMLLVFLYELRTQTALMTGVGVALSILLSPSRGPRDLVGKSVTVVGFAAMAAHFAGLVRDAFSPDQLMFYLDLYGRLRGGHESLTAAIFEIPLPWGFIPRLFYGLFSPLPGLSFSLMNVLFFFSVIVLLALFPFFMNGLRLVVGRRSIWALVVFAAIGFLPFALVTGAVRNIPYYWPFFVMIAGIGAEGRPGSGTALRRLYGFQFLAALLLVAAYATVLVA
jgi:hypothetical protein